MLLLTNAIYPKLLEVLTLDDDAVARSLINLRIGDFQSAYTFIAVIGKRFQGSGLSDLIVEAKVLGPNAVEKALHGKQCGFGHIY